VFCNSLIKLSILKKFVHSVLNKNGVSAIGWLCYRKSNDLACGYFLGISTIPTLYKIFPYLCSQYLIERGIGDHSLVVG
jgi:hypothetical protein